MEKDQMIVRCLHCGTKNRIPKEHMQDRPTCGKCHAPLDEMIIRCLQCGTKNRVPENRPNDRPLCGKCGAALVVGGGGTGIPVEVTDDSFQQEVVEFPGVILVDCWAPWCGPCKIVSPILDDLALEYAGSLKIVKLNVDENPKIASEYDIRNIPTMILFRGGKVMDRLVGALPKETIEQKLMAVLKEN